MRVREILNDYMHSKRRVAVLKAQLKVIDDSTIIKTTKFTDEMMVGGKKTVDDIYHERIEGKERMELELKKEEGTILIINAALEILKEENESDYKLLELRHIKKKTLTYIEAVEGIPRSTLLRRLRVIENDFRRMLKK
jgi:hypothetical protein